MRKTPWAVCLLLVSAYLFAADDEVKPQRHRKFRIDGISVSAGYSHFSQPYWGWPDYWDDFRFWGPYSYGFYNPWYAGPWIHPGFYTGFAYGPNMGEVKLRTPRTATVFLNGAYAGSSAKLKNMWLEPGVYTVELRGAAGPFYEKKIYVLSGKTLTLDAAEVAK